MVFSIFHASSEDNTGITMSLLQKTPYANFYTDTGCSRIYDPISKFYKKQASKDSTKTQIFSGRL